MFSQMCEAVAVCHESGVSHRDIKPENFICCDSVELESAAEGELDFGPQAKRKVVVKLTDFGLATTEEESGDVECGSKPYMSYECRNNLGPTYYPPAADVWSLGIVLINMLFHRNPWKDPTEGDPNFDNFLRDPTGFLLAKFTGIGREVAAYLACHVLCTEVEDRVTARDFGQWIKSLPEMIGGRKALRELKMARLETRANQQTPEKGLFAKSPIPAHPFVDPARKTSASALTSSAPLLSSLPPPASLAHQPSLLPTPDLVRDQDADGEEMKSATTIDEQPTPADTESFSSPDPIDPDGASEGVAPSESDARSLSTHKRRKRGVRKGKAAQAALAAAAAGDKPSQEERDAMLKELAQASQSLARHLSKTSRPASEFDATDTIDFPPLGTTPSQAAAAKKSKWKDMMKLTSGNPELAALARRVAERDGQSGGNWSAPAEMQHNAGNRFASSVLRPPVKQTATISSTGDDSILSTSFNHAEDEDWRAKAALAREELEDRDEQERAKKAQMAAQALTAGFEPMGAFGTHRPLGHGHPGHARSIAAKSKEPGFGQPSHRLHLHTIEDETTTAEPPFGKLTTKAKGFDNLHPSRDIQDYRLGHTYEAKVSVETASSSSKTYSTMSMDSSVPSAPPSDPSPVQGMNRPKLKGQIQSLAKMLSGLKTKGKD
jgi:serine/threonine protein kinase